MLSVSCSCFLLFLFSVIVDVQLMGRWVRHGDGDIDGDVDDFGDDGDAADQFVIIVILMMMIITSIRLLLLQLWR